MDIKTIEKTAQRYREKVEKIALEKEVIAGSSYRDITSGPITVISCTLQLIKAGKQTWEQCSDSYLTALDQIRTYLSLIERFPEFAEKETKQLVLKGEGAAFPDLRRLDPEQDGKIAGYTSPRQAYIGLSKKMLENKLVTAESKDSYHFAGR